MCIRDSGYIAQATLNEAIAIGRQAHVSDDASIGIGYLIDIDGRGSVGIGKQAMFTLPADSAVGIGTRTRVDSANSIAIGTRALSLGRNSVVIGHGARISGDNSVGLGSDVQVTTDNTVIIGNPGTSSIGGPVNWTATSDGRFKCDVQENVPGLDFINALRPVTYHYDIRSIYDFQGRNIPASMQANIDAREQIAYAGFIAQEVEAIAQKLGFEFSGIDAPADPSSDAYGLRYAEFVVPLVKAVQELDAKVKTQEQIINQQQASIKSYQALMSELTTRLGEIERKVEANSRQQIITQK